MRKKKKKKKTQWTRSEKIGIRVHSQSWWQWKLFRNISLIKKIAYVFWVLWLQGREMKTRDITGVETLKMHSKDLCGHTG